MSSALPANTPAPDRTHEGLPFTTIPEMLRWAVDSWGDAVAIEDGDEFIRFPELSRRVDEATRAFIASGIEPGDRVAIWAPNVWEWIVAALGIHHVGGVLVPLNTRYKGAEAAYILQKSGARLLFTVQGFLGNDYLALLRSAVPPTELPDLEGIVILRGDASDANVESWAEFLNRGASLADGVERGRAESVKPTDLSDILFTSGTTGHPKGVMTTHAQNLRAFLAWTEVIGLRNTDRYLIVNPFFHAFGYKAGWLSALMRGATILPHPVFDANAVLRRLSADKISMLPGPPALFQSLLAHPELAEQDLSSLRLAVTGAAVIPVELIHRMRDELHFETIITGYGLTEVCGIATMCRFDDEPETIARTSGRAIPDVEVLVVDESNAEVPRGEPGEIVVRGYNVMKGYFEAEEQTAATVDADGWLHTGDIGVMDDRGYVRITDRKKDMFINGGFNCYPAEIEILMLRCADLAQVAVVGVPDERLGEVGMAFVVPRPGAAVDPAALIAWCRETMANFKAPRWVELVDTLPTNALGKVQKFILRERAPGILKQRTAAKPN